MIRRFELITKISIWLLIAQLGILTAAAPALHGLYGCANHSHSHHAGCDHGHNHSHSHSPKSVERPEDVTGWKATEIRDGHDCLICRFLQAPVDVGSKSAVVTVLDFPELTSQQLVVFSDHWREFERARGPPRIL